MASTITLGTTSNWASTFLRNAPLVNIGGVTNEPTLTIGNWTRQMILALPWRWNRASTSFVAAPGLTDFSVNLPNFGWLERATLVDTSQNNITSHELEVMLNVGVEKNPSEPRFISARLDDDQGNITFRISPPSANTVTIFIDYQIAAPTFAALTDFWAPIPDYLSFLYDQGFLYKSYEYWNDDRLGQSASMFVASLISANGNLTESQIDIFNQIRFNQQREALSEQPQLSRKAKGLF